MADYCAVRRELQLYNPEYCARPHLVALNKTDLLPEEQGGPGAARAGVLETGILGAAQRMQV